MAGFRSVVVAGHLTVDVAIVRDIVEHDLDDVLQFAAVIRARL